MLSELRARLQIFVSGQYGHFNLFCFTFCIFLLIAFALANVFCDVTVRIVASAVLGIMAVGLLTVAAVYFLRQKPRGSPDGIPIVEANSSTGLVKLTNPPDTFYEPEQMAQFLRLLTVGFDENLCPDGEIIGQVADGNVRKLTDDEKEKFVTDHRAKVKAARKRISQSLLEKDPPVAAKGSVIDF